MRTTSLLENLEFHDRNANAQPLYVDEDGRIIRFMLQPGQSISEHNTPNSPFYVIGLQGHGMFAGADGVEQPFGPNDLLVLDKGETHSVRALDEGLVFVGILHGVAGTRPGKVGGTLGNP